MGSIRVTPDLHRLLRDTAAHTGLDVSDVIRKTALGIRRGRAVVRCEVPKTYYEKPAEVIRIRDFAMPEGIEPEEFRRLLAMRCMEELNKPKAARPEFPSPAEGGYIVENEE
jgi:hypothetical protein